MKHDYLILNVSVLLQTRDKIDLEEPSNTLSFNNNCKLRSIVLCKSHLK